MKTFLKSWYGLGVMGRNFDTFRAGTYYEQSRE